MARKHEIRILCDMCLDQDIETDGIETPPVAIGTSKPRVLALCKEEHYETWLMLESLVETYGLMPDRLDISPKKPKRQPAPGSAAAPTTTAKPPRVTEAACGVDDCPVVYRWPENKRPAQAAGVHRQRKHGVARQR